MDMKLFQIEEPDGSMVDPDAPGVAIGIDAGGRTCEVAVAVGGNAALLADREGFARELRVPAPGDAAAAWQALFEAARLRAERALAQPVTHTVVALTASPATDFAQLLTEAAAAAGLALLRITTRAELAADDAPALAAAILAEDLAPRPAAP
jgi:hypothetical protein